MPAFDPHHNCLQDEIQLLHVPCDILCCHIGDAGCLCGDVLLPGLLHPYGCADHEAGEGDGEQGPTVFTH